MHILFDDRLLLFKKLRKLRLQLKPYLATRAALRELKNLSLDAYPETFGGQNTPGSVAFLTFIRHQADRGLALAFTGHFNEAQPRNGKDADLGAISLHGFSQRFHDAIAVGRLLHIDKIDHHDPAD